MIVIWSGLSVGAIYALTALAYTIVFIPSGTFNFAQAFFVMLGTFLAYTTLVSWHLPWIVAVLVCGAVAAAAGCVEEWTALRPIRGKGAHAELVTTVGYGFLLTGISQLVWGTSPLEVPFVGPNTPFSLLGGRVRPNDFALIITAVVVAVGLWFFSRRSMTGLASLAAAQDRDAAALKGVNVNRLSGWAVVLACCLSGMVGPLIAPETYAVTSLGTSLVIVACRRRPGRLRQLYRRRGRRVPDGPDRGIRRPIPERQLRQHPGPRCLGGCPPAAPERDLRRHCHAAAGVSRQYEFDA